MLEDAIKDNTATMKLLITALKGGTAAAAAAAGTVPSKETVEKPAAPKGPKITMEMVKVAVVKVKDAKGKPAAQKIIKDVGLATELLAIKTPHFPAVIAACEALLSEEEEPEAGDEADDEDSL